MSIGREAKLLRHYDRIRGIMERKLLPPVMPDVDPVNGTCNLDCAWCCQAASREATPAVLMPESTMKRLGPFCRAWGVKAWRISSDSEPLLNKNISVLIDSGADNGIDMGLITNGVYLERVLESAGKLQWLGVSLDASTREVWAKLKRADPEDFDKILVNVRKLRDRWPQLDISLKFLRWSPQQSLAKSDFRNFNLPVLPRDTDHLPDNRRDAELLPELARSLGVNQIVKDSYPKDMAEHYGFTKCMATPLGGVFGADHRYHLCCDMRSVYIVCPDYTADDWTVLPRRWGDAEHLALIDSVNPRGCTACAKFATNEVLQHIVGESEKTGEYQVNFI